MPADRYDTEEDMPRSLQAHVERIHSVVSPLVLEDGIAVRCPYMHQTGQ